ncbi:High-affinity branched-chain amino acid transport system permease protein LivH [bacterium HR40]|nr:High-affinity branched-chain amino acid transport system permease protein LivH [bacterium HR40]
MAGDLLQFLFAGITVGAIYALIALGFSLVYSASHVINFAQGEFVMLGGMGTVFAAAAGLPLPIAALAALVLAVLAAMGLERLAIHPARDAGLTGLVIVTIGASILIRGLAGIVFDRNFHTLPALSGDAPLLVAGATLHPQALWILAATLLVALALWLFFARSLTGKAMLAAAVDPLAAELAGIDPRRVVLWTFALAGGLGALAGFLVTPLAQTHFQIGVLLGLKGFAAAIVGGLGSAPGAMAGGLVIGLVEQLTAGYLSSAYKDAVAFVVIVLVLLLRPSGLFGTRAIERV